MDFGHCTRNHFHLGKLADCTYQSSHESEIFIVEGDSAGGSTKQGRDRRFQAVLPLRGKILNAERNDEASIYKNKELTSLMVALGLEQKGEDELKKLRYDKIIILTDADVDGAHIRTLLLTFLYRSTFLSNTNRLWEYSRGLVSRFRRYLFEYGKVYVAVPPLYKVRVRGGVKYCYSDRELESVTKNRKSSAFTVQRFKGLGEMMPEELWSTTLNPDKRVLRKLTVDDFSEADRIFNVLMGDKVEPRRQLIEEEGSKLGLLDLDI